MATLKDKTNTRGYEMKPIDILSQYYGYSSFKQGQEKLIEKIMQGNDVLGIMPTGAGKSVCYQVPAMLFEGITIVISPLISLMKDQVDALKEIGIEAGFVNSSLSAVAYRQVIKDAFDGKYKLLYVAPERLESSDFLALSHELNISMIAVDEAHCVSQWGHDFRPSYTQIATYIKRLSPRPVVVAFTATATTRVKEDIEQLIQLNKPYIVATGFDRPNLYFQVEKPKQKSDWLLKYVSTHKEESGIIYCSTRKAVDALTKQLYSKGLTVVGYHAGLSEQERMQNQETFLYDKASIMVATNAFGMGIDKSNIRFVIHYNMPKNMESYYQEAGRGGRDGEKATCILLYSPSDIMTNRLLIENGRDEADLSAEYEKLNQMVDYCNTEGCLRSYIVNYFDETELEACKNCGNCNSEVEKEDITIEAQKICSCIKRMKERFGIVLVVEVLKGANTQKIHQFGFNTLTTYGIMSNYSKEDIKEMISYLIAERYLTLEGDKYPIVTLAPTAYNILKGEETVSMRKRFIKKEQVEKGIIDTALFIILKDMRKKIAEVQHVPPFMIFSDSTLNSMCSSYPTTLEALSCISGVGNIKLEKYGYHFVQAITDYVKENKIQKPETIKELFLS